MTSTWPKATIVALAACAVVLAVGWQHGAASPLAVVDLASHEPSSHIFGVQVADKMGQSLTAGDFNGDGTDDILISADEADGPANGRTAAGEAYVIWLGDSDGDSLPDIGDPCPSEADCDDDQFNDYVELYVGTDPLDDCPDGPSDDAWPLDINMDRALTVAGDALNFRERIGAMPGSPEWWQRLDLNADGAITVAGDALLYRGMIGESCTQSAALPAPTPVGSGEPPALSTEVCHA